MLRAFLAELDLEMALSGDANIDDVDRYSLVQPDNREAPEVHQDDGGGRTHRCISSPSCVLAPEQRRDRSSTIRGSPDCATVPASP